MNDLRSICTKYTRTKEWLKHTPVQKLNKEAYVQNVQEQKKGYKNIL